MSRLNRLATFAASALFLLGCPGISVSVSPARTSVNPGQTVAFTAAVTGNPNGAVSWSVQEAQGGSVDAVGVYTAPASEGTYHVVATSLASLDKSASAIIDVTTAPVANIAVSPAAPVLMVNETQQFSATVTGSSNTDVAWSVLEPSGGSIDAAGLYTAPAVAGTYHVDATSAGDPTKRARATVTATDATPLPTISGAVAGGGVGRIYVTLDNGDGQGTSLGGTGTFTIRGVTGAARTVAVRAFLDANASGAFEANFDPVGTANATFDGTNSVTGVSIALGALGALPIPPAPTRDLFAAAAADSVLLSPSEVTNGNGLVANEYLVYWSTTPNPGPGNQAAESPKAVPATNGGFAGLLLGNPIVTPGQSIYVSYSAVNSAGEGPVRSNPSPVTVQAATGGSTVSGLITLASAVSWPIIAGVYSDASNTAQYARTSATGSPRTYSIPGVTTGAWSFFGAADLDNDGVLGPLDPSTGLKDQGRAVNIQNPSETLLPVGLPLTVGEASVTTHRRAEAGTNVTYELRVEVGANIKAPVKVVLTSASDITTPVDVGLDSFGNWRHQFRWPLGAQSPSLSAAYELQLLFADSTSGSLGVQPTAVLTNSPTPTAPSGATGSLTPTFSWTLGGTLPAGYRLSLDVQHQAGGSVWSYDLPQGATSVVYDADGKATALAAATAYLWTIRISDVHGNSAEDSLTFTTP